MGWFNHQPKNDVLHLCLCCQVQSRSRGRSTCSHSCTYSKGAPRTESSDDGSNGQLRKPNMLLLMEEIPLTTWDVKKPWKEWDKLATSTLAGFLNHQPYGLLGKQERIIVTNQWTALEKQLDHCLVGDFWRIVPWIILHVLPFNHHLRGTYIYIYIFFFQPYLYHTTHVMS